MNSKPAPQSRISLFYDFAVCLPGWLLLLIIDPSIAIAVGLPCSIALISTRRAWWKKQPITGRIAVLMTMPTLALSIALGFLFGCSSPLLGFLPAFCLVLAVELFHQRRGQTLFAAFPCLTSVALLVLGAAFSVLFFNGTVSRFYAVDIPQRLTLAPEPPTWSETDKQASISVSRSVFKHKTDNENNTEQLIARLSSDLGNPRLSPSPQGVYVTLYEKHGYWARGFNNEGDNSFAKVVRATAEALGQQPAGPTGDLKMPGNWTAKESRTRIQIDVPGTTRKIPKRPHFHLLSAAHRILINFDLLGHFHYLSYAVETGIDGLEIKSAKTKIIVLPGDPITRGWTTPRLRGDMPGIIRAILRAAWLENTSSEFDFKRDDIEIKKFGTTSFGESVPNSEVHTWFRANTLLGKLDYELMVKRTTLTVDWLARQVQDNGRFHYEYRPPVRDSSNDYSLPRHAGSVYALLAFYHASAGDPAFAKVRNRALESAVTAMSFIEQHLEQPDPGEAPDDLCFTDKRGNATSGGTALVAVAVGLLPDPDEVSNPELKQRLTAFPKQAWLRSLSSCVLQTIDSRGAVFRHWAQARTNRFVDKEPNFFPGEVMLSLIRTYRLTNDKQLLKAAQQIGDRQINEHRWKLRLDLPIIGDHWIMQALAEVAEVTGNRDYARLAVLMGQGYVLEQYPDTGNLFPDYAGAYARGGVPTTTRAASRGEALGGSIKAAQMLDIDTTDFDIALVAGARHIFEQQFTNDNRFFVPDHYDVNGAIRMGLVDNQCRIDNNAHAIVGLIATLKAIRRLEKR